MFYCFRALLHEAYIIGIVLKSIETVENLYNHGKNISEIKIAKIISRKIGRHGKSSISTVLKSQYLKLYTFPRQKWKTQLDYYHLKVNG